MSIITSTEFRRNQRYYLDLAEKEPVFITRAGKKAIVLTSLNLDNYPTAKEICSIQKGLKEFEKGKFTTIDVENLWESIV